MIREATIEDVPALVEMGRRFLTETVYAGRFLVNEAQMTALLEHLLAAPDAAVLVSECDGVPTGMLGLYCYAHPISGEPFASEVFWWVEPEFRGYGLRLLRSAERWAQAHGARAMQMVAPTDAVARVYQRLGFDKLETVYQRSL